MNQKANGTSVPYYLLVSERFQGAAQEARELKARQRGRKIAISACYYGLDRTSRTQADFEKLPGFTRAIIREALDASSDGRAYQMLGCLRKKLARMAQHPRSLSDDAYDEVISRCEALGAALPLERSTMVR